MKYYVRATTVAGVEELKEKVLPCFRCVVSSFHT